jgi:uncharacterized DUF497 family protein
MMGRIIISEDGRFEWDEKKNIINKEKHGFEFTEILPVFDDPYLRESYDEKHSTDIEERQIGIGRVNDVLVLYVCYIDAVVKGRIRIYSARKAKPKEVQRYYEQFKNFV